MEIELVAVQRNGGIGFKFRDASTHEEIEIKNALQIELETFSFTTLVNWPPMEEMLKVEMTIRLPFVWDKIS